MRTLYVVLVALSMMGAACPPPPPQPGDAGVPPGDAASACTRACTNLMVLGCPEMGEACVPTCEHVVERRITPFDPECVAAAASKQEVVRCPAVRCEAPNRN